MKKRLIVVSLLLALVMCMSLTLTACSGVKMDDDTMRELLNTLKSTYDGKINSTSYTVYGDLPTTDAKGNPTTVYLSWELSGTLELFITKTADENGRYTVQFPETLSGTINYTLKVTLVNEKGKAYTDSNKNPYSATFAMIASAITSGGNGGNNGGDGGNGGNNDNTGGNTGGDNGGSTTPTQGDGTQNNPYSVAQALSIISEREKFDYTGKVYVVGIVSGTVSTGNSGDYKFSIVDSGSSDSLTVHYAKPNGKTVATGDTVVVSGSLVNYNGTSEITTHQDENKTVITPCVIESVTPGSGSTGGNTGGNTGGDSGDTGGNTGGGTVKGYYTKVSDVSQLVSGAKYLIVYEDGKYVMDGSLSGDAAGNMKSVTITSNGIEATSTVNAWAFTITSVSGGYSVKAASGMYIGHDKDENKITYSASAQVNTISFTGGNVNIICAGGGYLRFNANEGQERFRFYKSATYQNQQAIQLYMLAE